mmetsp:Transcript_29575/g.61000  ORF Transcript_29575/g.61000 Transcript_29575/m.61000 type:complete len:342 (-) Transcript_29575:1969-2994(-)
MRVLQNDPPTSDEGCIVLLSRDLLLSFAHRDLVGGILLLFLGQLINAECGITSCCEEIEDRLPALGLFVDVLDGIGHWCHEARIQHGLHKLTAGNGRSILTHGSHDGEAQEWSQSPVHVDAFIVVRDRHTLWLILIIPLSPGTLIALHEVDNLAEEHNLIHSKGLPRNCQDVQPDLVRQPLAEGIGAFGLEVQAAAGLQQDGNITRGDLIGHRHDLQRHQELEEHLVALIESAIHVPIHLVGQEVDDLLHALRGGLRLLGVANRDLELFQELKQRAVVHPARCLAGNWVHHVGHICHVEVHDTASGGHRSELFALLVDLNFPFVRFLQFALHFLRLCLCVG